jgi:hypothetical protein
MYVNSIIIVIIVPEKENWRHYCRTDLRDTALLTRNACNNLFQLKCYIYKDCLAISPLMNLAKELYKNMTIALNIKHCNNG